MRSAHGPLGGGIVSFSGKEAEEEKKTSRARRTPRMPLSGAAEAQQNHGGVQ